MGTVPSVPGGASVVDGESSSPESSPVGEPLLLLELQAERDASGTARLATVNRR
jgi:hypothetical protein